MMRVRPRLLLHLPGWVARIDDAPRSVVLDYARGLSFETLAGSTDEQRVKPAGCTGDCSEGVHVVIQPQSSSFALTRAELAEGRIVARMINQDTVAVARLNLAQSDTTYWWVDSTAAGWRTTLVSSSADVEPISHALEIEAHAERRWYQSLARWRFAEQGEIMWTTCGLTGCCKGPPPQ